MNRLKKIFMSVIAIFLPWVIILMDDNPGGAFVAVIMQATVIGWPFATVWAWRVIHPPKEAIQHKPESTEKKKK